MVQTATGTEIFHPDGTADVTRQSAFSGVVRKVRMPVTEEHFRRWRSGSLIQDAFPHLTPDQREFLMTGITQEEWDETFKEDEE